MTFLIAYQISMLLAGWSIVTRWFGGLPTLLTVVGAFLLGTGIGVPITYFFSVLFAKTGNPILWGTLTATVLFIVYCLLSFKKLPSFSVRLNELFLVVVALAFSTWLMFKTFHAGAGGVLYVGSNNVFDFGHAIGLMRSISWGVNIPFVSPFFAGAPFFYHFYFTFWTALWEYFGVPAAWAVNIPSILGFASLLIVTYYVAMIAAKQKPLAGWIAVVLAVTNSSLAFWYLVFRRNLWEIGTYPFAGPFDGATISIYMTLNNYVNQRHLAFVIAVGLFLFLLLVRLAIRQQLKSVMILGAVAGLLFFWNVAVWGLVLFLLAFYLALGKLWKPLLIFFTSALATTFLAVLPAAGFLYQSFLFLGYLTGVTRSAVDSLPLWTLLDYLWQNLGLLPLIAAGGLFILAAKMRRAFFPFVFLFVLTSLFAEFKKRGFEQKFLSFALVGINILAAVALGWLWDRKQKIAKGVALVLFFILTISGVVDLVPIKNEFAYPLVSKETAPLISWIRTETPKDAVFVSYADMIDPVVLAGRKNFFGFFGNVGWYDRSGDVARVYAGDVGVAKANNVSYVLVPRTKRDDFRYTIDKSRLEITYQQVYEDDLYLVFAVGESRVR